MEQLYKLLYEETYILGNEYIKKERIIVMKDYESGNVGQEEKYRGQKSTFGGCLLKILGLCFVIFLIWFAIEYMEMSSVNQQNRQQMQTEYERLKEDFEYRKAQYGN